MTVDEEFSKLEENIRRLKIEFEAYFNGGKPRPPNEMRYGVEQAFKRYSNDPAKLNFAQRFRLNQLLQRYAVHNELWRKKLRDKEEGRAVFPAKRAHTEPLGEGPTRVVCSDPDREQEKVDQLLKALREAKHRTGESAEEIDLARFQKFLSDKTSQLKQKLGCEKVQYSVEVEDGKVKFTAVKAD
ncbi:MAG TPA: MXAN_5187 C-terminal domain-containing protein [Terriglobia bacterium]|nr:MXAN_5187 C-terminal domain-containing protein [Terriglobia bacterium]